MSDFAYVSSRLGNVKPETRAIAKELHEVMAAAGHDIWFMWGMGTSKEHASGTALDLMVRNEAAGDWLRNYIWAHRARLRLRHVIWEQHITSTVISPGVRRKMEDRGNPSANHYDHNHAWFFAGTYQPPTGSSIMPDSVPSVRLGASGESVRKIQRFLWANFPAYRDSVSVRRGVPLVVDGQFGPQTQAWVKEFQRRTGLQQDGEVGPKTTAKLREHGYQ